MTKASLAQRFEAFHEDNPQIYEVFVEQAYEWIERTGNTKLGAQMLVERVRWVLTIRTESTDYKINNDYAAFYARLAMFEFHELAGLFDLRSSEADEWIEERKAREESGALF